MAGRSESVKKVLVEFGDSKDVFELTCVGIYSKPLMLNTFL